MTPERTEWPTVLVWLAIVVGFASVLVWHEALPMVVEVLLLGVLSTWYLSLQHEVIHGHPTPWRRLNRALVWAPISLTVVFAHFERTHLTHHRDLYLTDPVLDPESRYATAEQWANLGRVARALRTLVRRLPAQVILGPVIYVPSLVSDRRWDPPTRAAFWREMALHGVGVVAVLSVVSWSGLNLVSYLIGATWLGVGLVMVRSFAEHCAGPVGQRTAVVRAGWAFSLLFLNNNLHVTHHSWPGVAWYRLPKLHVEQGSDEIAARSAGLYRGYWDVLRQYWWKPFCQPVHPYPESLVGADANA